jgi:hypothetical protein
MIKEWFDSLFIYDAHLVQAVEFIAPTGTISPLTFLITTNRIGFWFPFRLWLS